MGTFKLKKDWAGYEKGESVTIEDKTVIKAGFDSNLFEGKMPKDDVEDSEDAEELKSTK